MTTFSKRFRLTIMLFLLIFYPFLITEGIDKRKTNNQIHNQLSVPIQGKAIIQINNQGNFFTKTNPAQLVDQLRNNPSFNSIAEKIGLLDIEPLIDPKLLDGLKNAETVKRFFLIQYDRNVSFGFVKTLLGDLDEISSIEMTINYSIDFTPNDEQYPNQDHHAQLSSPQAWDIETGDSTVIIAIVDNGFDLEHVDLVDNYYVNQVEANGLSGIDDDSNGLIDDVMGYDFAEGDSNARYDPRQISGYKHGTHVAGIASATGNNEIGVTGVSLNSRILPIKVATDLEPRTIPLVHGLRGIAYAVAQGASVINLSWGGVGESNIAAQEVMNLAYEEGVIVVGSAGNMNTEALFYPASYHHVISVAWVDKNDQKAPGATYGKAVDLTAPGSSILATLPGNQYGRISGSSMSAPMVSGAVALLRSQQPNLSIEEFEKQIVFSAEVVESQDPSIFDKLGSGRLNLLNMLTATDLQEPLTKIYLNSFALSDSLLGNGNQLIEPGESFTLKPKLSNVSLGSSANVSIQLTTDNDSLVSIINGNLQISVSPDSEIELSEAFLLRTSSEINSGVAQLLLSYSGDNVLAEAESLFIQIGTAPILLVDDDDGGNNVEGFYSTPLDIFGTPYVRWDHKRFGAPTSELLKEFPIVIWFCEWAFPSLNPDDRSTLIEYLELGGNLFLSGQDIGWDLADPASVNATTDAKEFYENVIRARFVSDDAAESNIHGTRFDPIGNDLEFMVYQPGRAGSQQYPDVFDPGDSTNVIWNYSNNKGAGGLRFDGKYRLVYFGFGLEAINSTFGTKPDEIDESRLEVFERTLNFLHPLRHLPISDQVAALEYMPIKATYESPSNLPDQVNVHFKLPGDSIFQVLPLVRQYSTYSEELDLKNKEGRFEYYFELVDPNSTWYCPVAGVDDPFTFYVGNDTLPPVIFSEDLRNNLVKFQSYPVAAIIYDNTELDSSNLQIFYRISNSDVDSTHLNFDLENNRFVGEITGDIYYGDVIEYWIVAMDLAEPANQTVHDTVHFKIGVDNFEFGLDQWIVDSEEWGLDQSKALSGEYSLSTSPGQNYSPNMNIGIQTKENIDLSNVNQAKLLFVSQYAIESGDAGFVELKVGDSEWQIIAGPIAGLQTQWHPFNIDLLPFIGESECRLRFRFTSDNNTTTSLTGWFIDDVRIIQDHFITGINNRVASEFSPHSFRLLPIYPNPVRKKAEILLDISNPSIVSMKMYNLLGQKVRELYTGRLDKGRKKFQFDTLDDSGALLPAGIYFVKAKNLEFQQVQKIIIIH